VAYLSVLTTLKTFAIIGGESFKIVVVLRSGISVASYVANVLIRFSKRKTAFKF
jgi:hypothetical protein